MSLLDQLNVLVRLVGCPGLVSWVSWLGWLNVLVSLVGCPCWVS